MMAKAPITTPQVISDTGLVAELRFNDNQPPDYPVQGLDFTKSADCPWNKVQATIAGVTRLFPASGSIPVGSHSVSKGDLNAVGLVNLADLQSWTFIR